MRAVLTYHSIDNSGSPISISPAEFERHIAFLASGALEVLPLETLVAGTDIDVPAVALTFDDGFSNFESVALPNLVEHDLPATLFVVSDHVGGTNDWGGSSDPGVPTLPLLDWEGLGRVHEAGVSLGAHTRTHPHLTGVTGSVLVDELEQPQRALEHELGVRARTLAYPYGDHDGDVVRAAEERYDVACTTRLAALSAEDMPLRIPRLDMFYFRRPGRLETFGSARFSTYVGWRRGLRSIRSAVTRGPRRQPPSR